MDPSQKDAKGALRICFNWLKDNWILGLGALFILLSVAWFLRYLFLFDWLSPQNRIIALVLIAAVVYLGGIALLKRHPRLAQTFVGLGTLGVLFALSAGVSVYNLWSPLYPLIVIFLVLALTTGLAITYNMQALATVVVIGAMAMPQLLGLDVIWDRLGTLSYDLLIALLAFGLAITHGWGWPLLVATMVTVWSFNTTTSMEGFEPSLDWPFLLAFQVLFAGPPLYGFLRSPTLRKAPAPATLFFALVMTQEWRTILSDNPLSVLLLGLTLLIVILGYAVVRQSDLNSLDKSQKWITAILALWSLAFITWATNLLLSDEHVIMVLFVVALAAVEIAQLLYHSSRFARHLSIYFVVPLFLLLTDSVGLMGNLSFESPHYWMRVVAALTTALAAVTLWRGWISEITRSSADWRPCILAAIAMGLGLVVIWDTSDTLFGHAEIARGVTLFIFTLLGETALYFGSRRAEPAWRYAGIFLIAFVVLRMLCVEVWLMNINVRIVTFMAIGVLLVLTALFDRQKPKR